MILSLSSPKVFSFLISHSLFTENMRHVSWIRWDKFMADECCLLANGGKSVESACMPSVVLPGMPHAHDQ